MAYQMPTLKVQNQPPRPVNPGFNRPMRSPKDSNPHRSWVRSLITLVVIILIVALGIYLIADFAGLSLPFAKNIISKDKWQAVFLDNGQVYFGKITKMDDEFLFLKDIYYLQVVNLQDQETISQPADVQTQPSQRLTLIKMGNEIHAPMDEMSINRQHVVLIEELKNDSRVVEAINDYTSGKTAQPEQKEGTQK